ncbi:MAG: phage/plasmid primase, P4 family [Pseudomonadota bacterium]
MGLDHDIRAVFGAAEQITPSYGDGAQLPPPDPDEEPIEAACAALPLNDYGNGQRFLAHFGEDCLFVPRVGWHRWTRRVWRLDDDKIEVRALAQQIGKKIVDEVPFIALEDWERAAIEAEEVAADEARLLEEKDDPTKADRRRLRELGKIIEEGRDARKALGARKRSHRNHGKTSGNSGPINNMMTEASVAVAVPLDRMNADPYCVNTESGVIRFFQGVDPHDAAWSAKGATPAPRWRFEVLDHSRDLMISKMMRAKHDPQADCPVFKAFIERILPDPDIRAFIKRWFGYSITGLTTEQKLVFAYGDGRNGKSTLVDLIAWIMADYATSVPIESLTGSDQRKGSDATPDLVRVPGARMVRASEPEQGQRMKEALIKALTGGEPVLIRRMMQEFVEVVPEFKLTIQGNHKPEIRGDDEGIWRRVLLVPFEQYIPDEEVDKALPDKMRAEASGVLNWLIEGALEWFESGLGVPDSITAATDEYRSESDPLRVFLLTECEISGRDTDRVTKRDMTDAFQLWMHDQGNEPWGSRAVANRLKKNLRRFKNPENEAIFSDIKSNGVWHFTGIGFRPEIAVKLLKARESGAKW